MANNYPHINKKQCFTYSSRFNRLYFSISGDEENKQDSFVNIVSKEQFKGPIPASGGIYDSHMGTTDNTWRCSTCSNRKTVCPGHYGGVQLKYPVKNPLFKTLLLKYLKVICTNCGNLLTKSIKTTVKSKILAEAIRLARDVTKCPVCGTIKKKILQDKISTNMFYYETGIKKECAKRELFNHEIYNIVDRVSDETVEALGKPLSSHPRKLILHYIKAPPNTIRPDRRNSGVRNTTSDTTQLLKTLVEYNESLPDVIPDYSMIYKDLREPYYNVDLVYHNLVKGSSNTGQQIRLSTNSNKTPSSIASAIPRKQGVIRRNLMGKRVWMMIRSVITGDNTLKVDEIGIPVSAAKITPIPEVVYKGINDKELQAYFDNGVAGLYPGCSSIIKAEDGAKYKVELLKDKNYILQHGDVVFRDIIDGDPVNYNRQPSLTFSSISTMRAKVMPEGQTIRMAVSACSAFNADFDGDQMHAVIQQAIKSMVDAMYLSDIKNWMVSYQNSKPLFGCFQDSLIGTAEFTRYGIRMNKWHVMALLSQVDLPGKSFDIKNKIYTNREVISMILPKINVSGKSPASYMKQFNAFIKYDPEDIVVEIDRGELKRGILDAALVGQGKNGSIFHIINNEFGNRMAIDTIFNIQQLVTQFLYYKGMTTGINDITVSKKTEDTLKGKLAKLIQNSRQLIKQLNEGKLVAPIGQTLYDYFEQESMDRLEQGDDFIEPILADMDSSSNGLLKLVLSGSKGKKDNISSMHGTYGQTTINGRRIPLNFGTNRSSPYFLRYDLEPKSLGYIANSFKEGIQSDVFPFAAAEARFGEICKHLGTSISGAQNRLSIKNLESILVDNMRKASKGHNVIQPLYAESGIDPRKVEKVKFKTVDISDSEFRERYYTEDKKLPNKFRSKKHRAILDMEFQQLSEDRQTYRDIFLTLEKENPEGSIFSNEKFMPVNVYRIIEDVLYNYRDDMKHMKSELDPILVSEKVDELIHLLPYKYMNHIQEKKRSNVPMQYQQAITLLSILIRSYLNTSYLMSRGVNNDLLDIIIDKINITFKKSLVDYGLAVGILAAQCGSEPLTQYVLDSKHRSGASGGTKTNTLVRVKEILGARETIKMKNPTVDIICKEEYENDKQKVQEIANHIEMMRLDRFLTSMQIFFEDFGNPVHPDYKHEKKFIDSFIKYNPAIQVPSDLSKWCIRFELNKETMILKNMKLFTIVTAIRNNFPHTYVVYSPENADVLVIRCYLRQSTFRGRTISSEAPVINIGKQIKNVVIRGIQDIESTEVLQKIKTVIKPDGSISTEKIHYIQAVISTTRSPSHTYGFMDDILDNPYVDKYKTQCDSILEYSRIYGIEAARQKIIAELKKAMGDDLLYGHSTIYADEMTYSGQVTSIHKTGLQKREMSNVTLRLSFQSPIQVVENAAIDSIVDNIGGISGPLMLGMIPKIGSTYNQLAVDTEFIEKEKNILADQLDEL